MPIPQQERQARCLSHSKKDRQDAYPTRIAKAEGRVLMETIRTCQRVLGMATSSEVELQQKSLDELSKMALELQSSIQKRFPSP
jgi:hypothetical protein